MHFLKIVLKFSNFLAYFLFKSGNHREAIEFFKEILNNKPNDVNVMEYSCHFICDDKPV